MKEILVYDDVGRFGLRYKQELEGLQQVQSAFHVDTIDNTHFDSEIRILNRRGKSARSASKKPRPLTEGEMGVSKFDGIDIMVVDIDLIESSNPFLTGDRVCYLLRTFSECKVIIGLSQYHKLDFDLGLRGQPGSFADLNVGYRDVANPGLWTNDWKDFRPWQWPNVPLLLDAFDSKVKEVETNIDAGVLKTLGIEPLANSLSPSARRFLGKDPAQVTFSDFVLSSQNGLRGNDKPMNPRAVARIASARITKWMERLVLPGQEILVDAPHLVSRYPSLLKGDKPNKQTWNKTTKFVPVEKLGIDYKRIEKFRFKKEVWTSRPAWFGIDLSSYLGLKEVSEPWKVERLKFAFCEDGSAFFPVRSCKKFVADVESSFAQRYIRRFPDRVYAPNSNLIT